MPFRALFIAVFLSTCCILALQAQGLSHHSNRVVTAPKTYVVYKVEEPISIDGKPDEKAWQKTAWTDHFKDITEEAYPDPLFNTRVKMLWDNQFLYIYAQLEEPHIWGTLRNHDEIIYQDNDFEVFIKNDEYATNYYEVEINALGTILDLFMTSPYRAGGKALISWDAKELKTRIHIEGSINDPSDTDSYWAVEMAIPFASISTFGSKPTPTTDALWRINFSRVQWVHEVIDGQYQRKKDSVGRHLPEDNWVWSPQGIVDMHYPERWGYIQFSNTHPDTHNTVSFDIPRKEHVKQKAWLIYYLQTEYRLQHGHYAPSKGALMSLTESWEDHFGNYQTTLSAGKDWYVAKVFSVAENLCFAINQHGQLQPSQLDDDEPETSPIQPD